MEDLLDLVHGAVKARIQLGFDKVSEEEFNLKPIIAELRDKINSTIKPLIVGHVP